MHYYLATDQTLVPASNESSVRGPGSWQRQQVLPIRRPDLIGFAPPDQCYTRYKCAIRHPSARSRSEINTHRDTTTSFLNIQHLELYTKYESKKELYRIINSNATNRSTICCNLLAVFLCTTILFFFKWSVLIRSMVRYDGTT